MDVYKLSEAILKGGLRSTNYFNGRLLSAEALSDDQAANREAHRRLGRAIGAGIVWGLEVSKPTSGTPAGTTRVNVSAGVALSSGGDLLSLPDGAAVDLTRAAETSGASAGLFKLCEQPGASPVASSTGLYVLTIYPTSGFSGRAPSSGLSGTATGLAGCGSSYAVEGVQLRLVPLSQSDLGNDPLAGQIIQLLTRTTAPELSRLQNLLAQLCFGGVAQARLARDPLQRAAQGGGYTLLDTLRVNQTLDDCEVALALLHWGGQSLGFVEHLAVRHRLTAPVASGGWEFLIGDRRQSQAEAAFLQFQAQLAGLRSPSVGTRSVRATDYFAYLPPAGFLPTGATALDFSPDTFFAGLSVPRGGEGDSAPPEAAFIPAGRVEALIRASLAYPPIDLASGELIRLYKVSTSVADTPTQPYLIFTAGHMPDFTAPTLDLARFGSARFAPEL
ncbi:MAG: hypothetical protein HGA45_27730 [Chloroflexales bacterium]|nr:hypothetical protein [Chloroflexales bacterium]